MATNQKRIDFLAKEYEHAKLVAYLDQQNLDELRERIVKLVLKEGQAPARAAKTLALRGEEYELRVSRPVEISVDGKAALRLKLACARAGAGRIFGRLFRKVETFVPVDGADRLMEKVPARAPRNLRSLFARALRVRELAPQLEIRELKAGKKEEAA